MPDHEQIAALVERIVAGARIPSRAARDDLRRELWTHFDDAAASGDVLEYAVRRFGPEREVAESLRRVYRRDYAALYLAKIAASIVASAAAAVLILALVNLRVELQADAWRLAPGFWRAIGTSLAVVLGLVTAWEAGRPPFRRVRAALAVAAYVGLCGAAQLLSANAGAALLTAVVFVVLGSLCWTIESRMGRFVLTLGAFAAAEYGIHLMISVNLGPGRALLAGAVLVAVSGSTMAILTRLDDAFTSLFQPAAS
jgi:hypothetical protein